MDKESETEEDIKKKQKPAVATRHVSSCFVWRGRGQGERENVCVCVCVCVYVFVCVCVCV